MRELRVGLFVAAAALPVSAGAGCDWATEATPVVREPTRGAEVTLTIVGKGKVVSSSEATEIRCPDLCYARIVPSVATDAAPTSITLKATPDRGYRFARWEADGARVPSRTSGPAECSPVRRLAETPQLGSAAEVTLPFGDVEGYPPPGFSEKCVDYSRVPLAYNLTAVFEPTLGEGDLWVALPGNERAVEMKVVPGRVFVRTTVPASTTSSVLAIDAAGNVDRLVGGIRTDPVDLTGHHVVWQELQEVANGPRPLGLVHSATGAVVQWNPTPATLRCTALTSTNLHVYCRTTDQRLLRWGIDGLNQTTILSALPAGGPMTTSPEDVFLTVTDSGKSSIQRLVLDAGPAALQIVGVDLTSPRRLRADARYVYAISGTNSASSGVRRIPRGLDEAPFLYSPRSALELVYAVDATTPEDPVVWIAGLTTKEKTWQITSHRGGGEVIFRLGLDTVSSMGVDVTHVYWSQTDGKIYRSQR